MHVNRWNLFAKISITLGLGVLLFTFQNCSGGMDASQELGNLQLEAQRSTTNDEGVRDVSKVLVPPAGASCLAKDLKLAWPFTGVAYQDWNVYQYIDENPVTGAMLDYMGNTGSAALAVDGHTGIDIDVPDFRYMDNNFPVNASAGGVVTLTYAASYDRNTSCSTDPWNEVVIQHPNGFFTIYGHMKQNSIVVQVGQTVVAGQKLGVVGSSGCSIYPEVHLEVLDCNQNVVDSAKQGMIPTLPPYAPEAPTGLMQTVIKQPIITESSEMVDPGVDTAKIANGVSFSAGITLANFKTTDSFVIQTYDPSGKLQPYGHTFTTGTFYRISNWWANMHFATKGTWTLKYLLNGKLVDTRSVVVD